MLSKIRNNMKAFSLPLWIVAASFVGTIFLVWGRGSVSGPSSGQVATINGHPIEATEFFRQVNRLSKEYEKRFGENYRKVIGESQIKRIALNQLIVRKLLIDEAEREGIKVSDWAVANRIRSFPFLQDNGNFSESLYRQFLKVNRLTPKAFEDMVREDLKVEKLKSVIDYEPTVLKEEVRALYRLNFGKRPFEYKLFLFSQFSPKVSEKEIEEFYRENRFMFRSKTLSTFEAIKIPKGKGAEEIVKRAFNMAKSGKLSSIDGYLTFTPDEKLRKRFEGILKKSKKDYGFVEIDGNYYVFLRKTKEEVKPLSKVKSLIEMKIKQRKAKLLAEKAAKEFMKSGKWKPDGKLKPLNKEELFTKLKIVNSQDLGRLFEAKTGDVVGPVEVFNGYALIKPVGALKVKSMEKEKVDDLRGFLLQTKREAAFESYVDFLRNRATIKVNSRYLK